MGSRGHEPEVPLWDTGKLRDGTQYLTLNKITVN